MFIPELLYNGLKFKGRVCGSYYEASFFTLVYYGQERTLWVINKTLSSLVLMTMMN